MFRALTRVTTPQNLMSIIVILIVLEDVVWLLLVSELILCRPKNEVVLVRLNLRGGIQLNKVVKEVADIFEADVEIYERPFGATANLKLEDCTVEKYVKNAFVFMLAKADNISWFTKEKYTLLSLDYYTHELYYKGECKHRIT